MKSDDYEKIAQARKAFATGKTKIVSFRKNQLRQLAKFLKENESALCDAIMQDLRRSKMETVLAEIVMTNNAIVNALENIDEWCKDEHQPKALLTLFSNVYVRKEPFGVCLVIASWNYPIALLLIPVISAIAAGNCVIIKPSECSAKVADLLLNLLPKYIDNECYPVVVTDSVHSAQLVENNRFDFIFFTGGTAIGRLIMKCAAEYLTPVVLELGGKNPCFVDKSCDIKTAARRICWGKFLNNGQNCLSTDYVLCEAEIHDEFIQNVKTVIDDFYGPDAQKSPDFGRIINDRQMSRLVKLLKSNDGKIVHGGKYDEKDKYISPTVVTHVTLDSAYMQQEMFGPILLIMSVANIDEAIETINKLEKPLAVYAFSNNKQSIDKLLFSTSSGGVCINDVLMHYSLESLPFGGIGNSGIGNYHGKFGFDAFTHKRAVLDDGTPEALLRVRYAPYSDFKLFKSKMLIKKNEKSTGIFGMVKSFFWMSVLGVILAYGLHLFFGV
uniref:Aldehyde dehydrogenase n=1 Tax=Phallusia mammillata TaxID=59560 RepID=A0A6F9D614_9ASCI|nr:fatty aldehyde dehydrogenase-like [Phallusia mammillata]